jgi:AcrR family transcriptional regulator
MGRKSAKAPVTEVRKERRMDADRRRAQLLECAIRVASRQGLGSSPHAATAREANVSVPTVFAYFRSRPELLRGIVGEVEKLYTELGAKHLSRDKPAPDAITDFLRACAHTAETDPDRVRVWLDWSSTVGSEVWPLYNDFHDRSIRRMAAVVRRGQREGSIPLDVDAMDAARLLFASGHTVAQMIFSKSQRRTVRRFQNHVITSALHLDPSYPGLEDTD